MKVSRLRATLMAHSVPTRPSAPGADGGPPRYRSSVALGLDCPVSPPQIDALRTEQALFRQRLNGQDAQ